MASSHPDRGVRMLVRGDKVVLTQTEVLSEMGFEAFAKNFLFNNPAQFDGVLPAGTRAVRTSGDHIFFLVEIEPSIQVVQVKDVARQYQIAMPWQYFYLAFKKAVANKDNIVWVFQDSRVFWTQHRIKKLLGHFSPRDITADTGNEDLAIPAKLPNIYQNSGKICFGNTAPDSTLTLSERVEAVINDFFSIESVFNGDLGWNFPNGYRSFMEWAKYSKLDPMCFLQWRDFNVLLTPHHRLGDLFPMLDNAKGMSLDVFAQHFRAAGGGAF